MQCACLHDIVRIRKEDMVKLFDRLLNRYTALTITTTERPADLPDFIDAELRPGEVVVYRPPIGMDGTGQLTGGARLQLAGNFIGSKAPRAQKGR